MPAINIEDLSEKDKLKMEVEQLRKEVKLERQLIIDKEINPFVDKWEEEGQFPAHKVFKTLGQAGFFGVDKPTGPLAPWRKDSLAGWTVSLYLELFGRTKRNRVKCI